jgi:DNA-binding transcriptional MerR regulator
MNPKDYGYKLYLKDEIIKDFWQRAREEGMSDEEIYESFDKMGIDLCRSTNSRTMLVESQVFLQNILDEKDNEFSKKEKLLNDQIKRLKLEIENLKKELLEAKNEVAKTELNCDKKLKAFQYDQDLMKKFLNKRNTISLGESRVLIFDNQDERTLSAVETDLSKAVSEILNKKVKFACINSGGFDKFFEYDDDFLRELGLQRTSSPISKVSF